MYMLCPKVYNIHITKKDTTKEGKSPEGSRSLAKYTKQTLKPRSLCLCLWASCAERIFGPHPFLISKALLLTPPSPIFASIPL